MFSEEDLVRLYELKEVSYRKTHAMAPLIQLNVCLIAICSAYKIELLWFRILLAGIMTLCVTSVLFAYFFLLFRDPERLRSEHRVFKKDP